MQSSIVFKIKGNSYKVEYPNMGQLRDIEISKMMLSQGMYGSLQLARTTDSENALNDIDAEAYISILLPDFLKDLKVKSFRELHPVDMKDIVNEFIEQLMPFVNGVRKDINERIIKKDETKD